MLVAPTSDDRSVTDPPSILRVLRVPDPGLVGRLVRFGLTGGLVAAVYAGATTILSRVTHFPFQLALVVAFCIALATHFTLQRLFVWRTSSAFALRFRGQVVRYLVVSGFLYASTAVMTAVVPKLIDLSPLAVYFIWTATASTFNFFFLGKRVFHPAR